MEIEIGRLVRSIRRFWWLPLVAAFAVAVLAVAGATLTPERYTATTRMLIVPREVSGPTVLNGSATVLIDLARSRQVLEQVILSEGLDLDYDEFRADVYAAQQTGTQFILVSVTHEDPQIAADLSVAVANAVETRANDITITELSHRQSKLEYESSTLAGQMATIDAQIALLQEADDTESGELDSLKQQRLTLAQQRADVDQSLRTARAQIANFYSEVSIVEEAKVPSTPDGFGPVILAIVGAFVGGLIGSALILLMAVRDNTVVNGAQVARITGAPILREVRRKTTAHDLRMALSFISGLRSVDPGSPGPISIVAPTELSQLNAQKTGEESSTSALAMTDGMHVANGVMAHEAALSSALQSSGVVLATAVGSTSESDLRTTVDSLTVAGIPILGSILFSER